MCSRICTPYNVEVDVIAFQRIFCSWIRARCGIVVRVISIASTLSACLTDTGNSQYTLVQSGCSDVLSPISGRRSVSLHRRGTGRAQSRKRALTRQVLQIPHRPVAQCLVGTAEEVEHPYQNSTARCLGVPRDGQSHRRTCKSPSLPWVILCPALSSPFCRRSCETFHRRNGKS